VELPGVLVDGINDEREPLEVVLLEVVLDTARLEAERELPVGATTAVAACPI
jgi:hypothetical protein